MAESRGRTKCRLLVTGMELDLIVKLIDDAYPKADGPTRKRLANIARKLEDASAA